MTAKGLRRRSVLAVLITACVCATVAGASSRSFPPPGRIVYTAATPALGRESSSLFTAATDGTGARQITTNAASLDVDARWSPDGTQVVFTRIGPGGVSSSVWVVNADGTDAHLVGDELPFAQHPKWSPDGRWIAFQRQTGVGPGGFPDESGYKLWLVHPDGSRVRSLDAGARSCDSGFFGYGDGTAWDWSPDSSHIVFTHESASRSCQQRTTELNVLDLNTGRNRRLTTGTYPAWSPVGNRIAFVDRRRIWLIPATGGKRTPITPRPRGQAFPGDLDWSPDGGWLAAADSAWHVRTPLIAGSDGKQREAGLIPPAAVRWPPDCTRLFFYRSPNLNSSAGSAGWIIHGPHGQPSFARVPALGYIRSEVDWRC